MKARHMLVLGALLLASCAVFMLARYELRRTQVDAMDPWDWETGKAHELLLSENQYDSTQALFVLHTNATLLTLDDGRSLMRYAAATRWRGDDKLRSTFLHTVGRGSKGVHAAAIEFIMSAPDWDKDDSGGTTAVGTTIAGLCEAGVLGAEAIDRWKSGRREDLRNDLAQALEALRNR